MLSCALGKQQQALFCPLHHAGERPVDTGSGTWGTYTQPVSYFPHAKNEVAVVLSSWDKDCLMVDVVDKERQEISRFSH